MFAVPLLLLGAAQLLGAQQTTRTVTGTVTTAGTPAPLENITISAVGTTALTRTDARGQYRIVVPGGDVTLVARGIGYKRITQRVPAAQSTADFTLEKDVLQLDQVVVTGQATTQERRNVSTAVSTVAAEQITRVPAAALDNALQGKVVGAQINMNSGAPGGGGQIQIRGVTSILGNGQPLYVVDGVIISNAAFSTGVNAVTGASGSSSSTLATQDNAVNRLADVNPNEIESVQVLKSAAATAIYGSKATNGVVLITTKRGSSSQPRIDLTQRVGRYDAIRLLGSRQFTAQTLGEVIGNQTVANQVCAGGQCPFYDYQSQLYGQDKPSYETILSVSGGNPAGTRYYLSGSLKDERGTQINSGATRQAARLNVDQTFGSRLNLQVSAAVNRSKTDRGLSNNDNTYTSPIYSFGYTPAVIDLGTRVNGVYPRNQMLELTSGVGVNPFQTLSALRNREDVWRQLVSATARYNVLETDRQTLALQATAGFDRYDVEGSVYSPNFLYFEPQDGFLGTAVQASTLNRQVNSTLSAVHTYLPGASGLLGFLTSATTSVGAQREERTLNTFSVQAENLVPTIDLIDQGVPTLFQTKQAARDQAFFVNEEILAFDERLSVSGRVRAERSSLNGDRDKFYFWPAASASYRFVSPFRGADEIKLRAGYGASGNQARYGDRDVVISGLGLIDGRVALGVPGTIGNAGIRPEKMTEQEYGLDATMFGGRVGFEGSYFDRTITDLLLTAPLAASTGFGAQIINGGELQTTGVELAVNAVPVRVGTFTWNTRAQYYTFTSMVNSLPDNVANFVLPASGFGASYGRGRIARGYESTLIWGNRYRADSTVVDSVVANSNPDFTMQFANDLTWREFSLNVLVDWRKGGYLSNLTNNLYDEGQNSRDYDDPSPIAGMPLGEYRYRQWNGGRNSSVYIQDGSYVKIREVSLAYRVPQQVTRRFLSGADNMSVTLTGRNLGIFSDYWGSDPEVNNFGNQNVARFVDLAPYPPSRSFFLSVNVGF